MVSLESSTCPRRSMDAEGHGTTYASRVTRWVQLMGCRWPWLGRPTGWCPSKSHQCLPHETARLGASAKRFNSKGQRSYNSLSRPGPLKKKSLNGLFSLITKNGIPKSSKPVSHWLSKPIRKDLRFAMFCFHCWKPLRNPPDFPGSNNPQFRQNAFEVGLFCLASFIFSGVKHLVVVIPIGRYG